MGIICCPLSFYPQPKRHQIVHRAPPFGSPLSLYLLSALEGTKCLHRTQTSYKANTSQPSLATPPLPPRPLRLISPLVPLEPSPPTARQVHQAEAHGEAPHAAPDGQPLLPLLPPPHGQERVEPAPRGGHGGRVGGVAREVHVRGEEERGDEEERGADGARVEGDYEGAEACCREGVCFFRVLVSWGWGVIYGYGGKLGGSGGLNLLPQA